MSEQNGNLAIIGAGVSGCALAARLRGLGWRGAITLLEAGQGAGGRAASRRSRRHPGWSLDHGAPFLTMTTADPPELLAPLLAAGRLRPWPEPAGPGAPAPLRRLEADGSMVDDPGVFAASGDLYRGWPAMADLAEGLLELAEAAQEPGGAAEGAPPLERRHGVRIEALARRDDQWQLRDGAGELQAQADWLVLSGTLLAHPRCLPLLGLAEIPLQAVQRQRADPALEQVLTAVDGLRYDPRLALLLRLEGAAATPWQTLPFRHLELSEAARARWGLERLSVQPGPQGRWGVVAQARPADLVRCGLLRAEALAGTSAEASEQQEVEALSEALLGCLSGWIGPADLPPRQQRQRMHWGGAFPLAPGLDPEAMVCEASRLALCGDAIEGPGFGRVEGGWRSGEWLAQRLLPMLRAPSR